MAISKHTNVQSAGDLALLVKNFSLQNTQLTDAGFIGSTNHQFALRNASGIFFNFNFTASTIETCMTTVKMDSVVHNDTARQQAGGGYRNTEYNYTWTSGIKYPIPTVHLITMGKLVAIVLEVKTGIYRHHIFGQYTPYNPQQVGGEFIGGTVTFNYNYTGYASPVQLHDQNAAYFPLSSNPMYFISPFAHGLTTSYYTQQFGQVFIRDGDVYVPLAVNDWWNSRDSGGGQLTMKFGFQRSAYFTSYSPNQYNGRVMMYPIDWHFHYALNETNPPLIPAFFTNDICLLNITNLNAGVVVNDDWIVFPVVTKQTNLTGEFSTNNEGVAYKFK